MARRQRPEPEVTVLPTPLPVAVPAEPSCGTCRHWREEQAAVEHDAGRCHRYPPTVQDSRRITAAGPLGLFILTTRGDVCGEHSCPV